MSRRDTHPDQGGRIPLHYAALEDDVPLVKTLLAEGADVNATDKSGLTPLHFACYEGNVEAVRILLDARPNLEIKNAFGSTPLSAVLTAPKSKAEIVSLLRERGADPFAVDGQGRTVVDLARWIGDPGVMRCFEDVSEEADQSTAGGALDGICAGTALVPEGVGAMSDYRWWEEHDRLWRELVPSRGQATTVQGELVRCIGRLTDEAYRNSNQNWTTESGHDRMLAYIEHTLLDDDTFDEERQVAIRSDIAEISDFEHPNVGGHGTCYYNLSETVVDWCMQHPEPVPRKPDADLPL